MKERRVQIKQQRIMKYFIKAAREIIKNEGISGVTIRKVADLAGYTSATLYNYFDNLPHLIFLANMVHLEDYNEKLPDCISECKNPIEIYMAICKCFTLYAYDKPDIFESFFYSQSDCKFEEYTEQYYAIFPEKEKLNCPPILNKIFHMNNLHNRSQNLLNLCVEEGYIEKENAEDFNDIVLRMDKTILADVKNNVLSKEDGLILILKYYAKLFGYFLKPEAKSLLENYYPKLLN